MNESHWTYADENGDIDLPPERDGGCMFSVPVVGWYPSDPEKIDEPCDSCIIVVGVMYKPEGEGDDVDYWACYNPASDYHWRDSIGTPQAWCPRMLTPTERKAVRRG